MRFDGRVAIVTGAARGMGRATAQAFAEAGARVLLAGRTPETTEAAAAELRAAGHDARAVVCDVGEPAAARAAAAAALAAWGRIDVLVNNAGVSGEARPVATIPLAEWDAVLRTNLTGPLIMSQAVIPAMRAQAAAEGRGGAILHNASIAGLGVDGAFAHYSASKAGLLALMRGMAVELAADRIRVNAVSPGYTRTEMTTQYFGPGAEPFLSQGFVRAPLRRLVTAEEVATAFVYLASDGASGITGANLVVDGGLTANLFIMETFPSGHLPPSTV